MSELGQNLEQYVPNRANFDRLFEEERERLATKLRIARSQVNNTGGNTPEYRRQLIEKRSQFFYTCGQLDIDPRYAKALWWNVVYGSPAPSERDQLV